MDVGIAFLGLPPSWLTARSTLSSPLGPQCWQPNVQRAPPQLSWRSVGDPVGNGVVSNLARPGGNITGFSYMSTDLAAKRLELLNETFSRSARIAILYNPDELATVLEMQETEVAARTSGVTLWPLAARHSDDLEGAFAASARERTGAMIVFTHGFAEINQQRIIELAARNVCPRCTVGGSSLSTAGSCHTAPTSRS